MKCTVHIGEDHEEEILIFARSKTPLIAAIEQLIAEDSAVLIGFRGTEKVRLYPPEVDCFLVENNKVYALSGQEKWQLKCRLYHLEEQLSGSFIKINQSCLINPKRIARFRASFSGTLQVQLKNGYTDYVSRRNLKSIKERFGL